MTQAAFPSCALRGTSRYRETAFTPELVDYLMQQGGWALLRFRGCSGSYGRGYQLMNYMAVPDPVLAYGYIPAEQTRSLPTAAEIFLMDETGRWLGFINDARERRICAKRALYDDDTGRCVYSYDKLAREFHTSAYHIRRAHQAGLRTIANWLRAHSDDWVVTRILFFMPEEREQTS